MTHSRKNDKLNTHYFFKHHSPIDKESQLEAIENSIMQDAKIIGIVSKTISSFKSNVLKDNENDIDVNVLAKIDEHLKKPENINENLSIEHNGKTLIFTPKDLKNYQTIKELAKRLPTRYILQEDPDICSRRFR